MAGNRDALDEAADTIKDAADEVLDTDDSATPFAKWEVVRTIKERLRMKDGDIQQQLVNGYGNELDRRQFLKLLGFSVGGAVIAGGTGWLMGKKVFSDTTERTITGMQAGNGYDTRNISGREVIRLDAGETLSDTLFDISGGSLVIVGRTDGWTIRNVGVRGRQPQGGGFIISPASTGEALIERVYLGDGVQDFPVSGGWHSYPGIMWAPPEHSGHVTVRETYVEGGIDNGMYFSAPGSNSNGQRGTFTIESCYAGPNHISGYRVGGDDRIRNCYSDGSAAAGRAVWVFGGASATPVIQDSVLDGRDRPNHGIIVGDGSDVDVENTSYSGTNAPERINDLGGNDNNPEEFMPDGVPTEPEMAAAGEGADGVPPGEYSDDPC